MLIRSGDVTLRSFDASSTDVVYAIRNHPSVRAHLHVRQPIERASHENWVRENLVAERKVHLFVVFSGDAPVGIALIRNFSGDSAEIGVMIVDAARRPLVCYKASHLIGYYAFEVLDLKRLLSYVPRHNLHALKFNQACGLTPTGIEHPDYLVLALTQTESRTHATHRQFREKYGIEVVDDA